MDEGCGAGGFRIRLKGAIQVQELKQSTNPYDVEHKEDLTTIRTDKAMKVLAAFWDQLHEVVEMFYNVWEPVLLKDAYVVRFNYQDGNGYIVIKQGRAMECWLQKHKEFAYQDCLSNRVVELESNSLMLTHMQKIADDKCALIYSRVSVESLDEAFKVGIVYVPSGGILR